MNDAKCLDYNIFMSIDFNDLVLPGRLKPSEWVDVKPFPDHAVKHSYVSGNKNSQAIRVRYYKNPHSGEFAGRVWFGPETEGPPGHAHGGSQAALLDEGMGAIAWLNGHSVLAAKIEIHFRKPLPLGTVLTMLAKVERVEGRKIYAVARLEADDLTVYSESTGLFIVINPQDFIEKRIGS